MTILIKNKFYLHFLPIIYPLAIVHLLNQLNECTQHFLSLHITVFCIMILFTSERYTEGGIVIKFYVLISDLSFFLGLPMT